MALLNKPAGQPDKSAYTYYSELPNKEVDQNKQVWREYFFIC